MANLLIIDDSKFTLQRHNRIFTALNCEVTTVICATEAYEELAKGIKFDLIVCDLLMPEEDGVTVLQNVKAKYPDQKMIIVSSDIQEKRKQEVVGYGALDLIPKPLDETKVKKILAMIG